MQQTNTQSEQSLVLKSPLSGIVVPLTQVPDPVFAQKMVGDGIAIEPVENQVCSPCDGVITHIHEAKHAIRIKSDAGPEILLHVGLDTVALNGDGFELAVSENEKVTAGQKLLHFDAEKLATKASSLMTIALITNYQDYGEIKTLSCVAKAGKSALLAIDLTAQSKAEEVDNSNAKWQLSAPVQLLNPQGIHARPAAVLSKTAKQFSSEIEIRLQDKRSNATSVVGLMGLNSKKGDTLIVAARGGDAATAIEAVVDIVRAGLGEQVDNAPLDMPESRLEPAPEELPLLTLFSNNKADIQGIAAAPGKADGFIYELVKDNFDYAENAESVQVEQNRLDRALASVEKNISSLVEVKDDNEQAEIFSAHLEMLSDPTLKQAAVDYIAKGKTAEYAWHWAIQAQLDVLGELNNPLLAQRCSDLDDLRLRLLSCLTGKTTGLDSVPSGSILLIDDLTPSLAATLSTDKIAGVITCFGGATSHAAILARAAGIPYVAGIKQAAGELYTGRRILLDGKTGEITLDPDEALLQKAAQEKDKAFARRQKAMSERDMPAVTLDSKQIEVVANIANENDAVQTIELGGEGVGLLRTEFLFQDRTQAPDEDEQYALYRGIQQALQGRPLIIRTLDVGGDKPLAYLPLPEEENPFLGERGLRVGLNRPSILRPQVRAILRANARSSDKQHGKVRIMFPMVSIVEEVRVAKQVVLEEAKSLGVPACEIGIMVEVPSTAAMAHQFAQEVDFFSIGSNDLSQYTLAIDRGHPKLAAQADGLNPGILRLIKMTVEGAHAHGKWVGVCGGLASEFDAVPVLLGLGVDELSVSVPQVPEVKALVRNLSLEQCQLIADQALAADSAGEVRALCQEMVKF